MTQLLGEKLLSTYTDYYTYYNLLIEKMPKVNTFCNIFTQNKKDFKQINDTVTFIIAIVCEFTPPLLLSIMKLLKIRFQHSLDDQIIITKRILTWSSYVGASARRSNSWRIFSISSFWYRRDIILEKRFLMQHTKAQSGSFLAIFWFTIFSSILEKIVIISAIVSSRLELELDDKYFWIKTMMLIRQLSCLSVDNWRRSEDKLWQNAFTVSASDSSGFRFFEAGTSVITNEKII